MAVSFQEVSGLRDSRMYGPHFTDEILAQIGNRFIGRLECPDTAEWASRVIGDQEVSQYTTGHSTSSGQSGTSNSTTNSQQIVTRRAVLPSEFLSIPPCGLENGLSGYFVVRSAGCYFAAFSGHEIFAEQLIPLLPMFRSLSHAPLKRSTSSPGPRNKLPSSASRFPSVTVRKNGRVQSPLRTSTRSKTWKTCKTTRTEIRFVFPAIPCNRNSIRCASKSNRAAFVLRKPRHENPIRPRLISEVTASESLVCWMH